jgi:hypothetical protein
MPLVPWVRSLAFSYHRAPWLGASVGNLGATAFPAYAPVIGPVVKIASEGTGWLLGNRYAAEIHFIIVARNEDVKRLAALLKRDMPRVLRELNDQVFIFEERRQSSLDRVQEDPKVTKLELYHEFKAARQDTNAVKALVVAARGYNDLLDSLVAAHDALAKDDPDSDVLIARFQMLSTDVAALITALRAEKRAWRNRKKEKTVSITYSDARADIIKSMEVERALIMNSTNADDRDRYLDNFEYLHSELAALDSQQLAQSGAAYKPLTIRLAHAANDLETDYNQAKQLAQNLNLTAFALDSMLTLVKALAWGEHHARR